MEIKFGEWGLLWPLARDSIEHSYKAPASASSATESKDRT